MRVPHRFTFRGKKWKWIWRRQEEWSDAAHPIYAESCFAERTVYADPKLANDPLERLDTFLHEVLHVIDETETTLGRPRWHLPHAAIERTATALAEFLIENAVEIKWPKQS